MCNGRRRRLGSTFAILVALGIGVGVAPVGAQRVVRGDDGAEMVLVPAGECWMGSTQADVDRAIEECTRLGNKEHLCRGFFEDELPRDRVALHEFYIDRHEVTNALYERFVRATAHRTTAEREGWNWVWKEKDGTWRWIKVDGAM